MSIRVTTPQASKTASAIKFQATTIHEPLYLDLDDAADAIDDVIYSFYYDLNAELDNNIKLQIVTEDDHDHQTADALCDAQVDLICAMTHIKNALDSVSQAHNSVKRYLRKIRKI